MAKYTIKLNTDKVLKDGTHPVVMRFSYGAKRSLRNIGAVSVQEQDWDDELWVKPSHPKAKQFNSLIRTKDVQAEDLFSDMDKGKNDLTIHKIIDTLFPDETAKYFFDFIIEYVENYKKRGKIKLGTNIESKAKAIWCFHNGVKKFPVVQTREEKYSPKSIFRGLRGCTLTFSDINDQFLKKLSIFMEVERGNNDRTIFNIMNLMRTMFNKAIKRKVISSDIYPFKDHKIKMPEAEKIGLDKEEILAFEKATVKSLTNTWLHAKNVWLFSFSFGGVRAADLLLLRWDDFKNGRLYYVMGKNNKPVSIEIPERAQRILDYYAQFKDENNGFVFPALKDAGLNDLPGLELKISNAIRIYNKWLKKLGKAAGIRKIISLHIARHSFGNITGDKISVQLLQLIYRHAKVTTTIGYQNNWINNQLVDQAVGSIVNF